MSKATANIDQVIVETAKSLVSCLACLALFSCVSKAQLADDISPTETLTNPVRIVSVKAEKQTSAVEACQVLEVFVNNSDVQEFQESIDWLVRQKASWHRAAISFKSGWNPFSCILSDGRIVGIDEIKRLNVKSVRISNGSTYAILDHSYIEKNCGLGANTNIIRKTYFEKKEQDWIVLGSYSKNEIACDIQ